MKSPLTTKALKTGATFLAGTVFAGVLVLGMQRMQVSAAEPGTGAAAAPPAAEPLIGPGMAEPPPMGESTTWSGRFMPRELAVEAAVAALDACRKRGARITVTIADATGMEHVYITDDGAKIVASAASRKKAAMVAATMRATQDTAKNPEYQQRIRDVLGDGVVNVSGGQPIWVGNEMIGAIAVGGRGAAEENWCALEGIRKIQSRLK